MQDVTPASPLLFKPPSKSNRYNEGTPSANRRIAFSQFRPETEKTKKNPRDPVNPVKREKSLAERTIEDVLLHLGKTKKVARRRYRDFVKKGIDQGARKLQGGGLVRSAGGHKAGLLGRKKEDREKGDERILGSGDFVNEALSKAGEEWESQADHLLKR